MKCRMLIFSSEGTCKSAFSAITSNCSFIFVQCSNDIFNHSSRQYFIIKTFASVCFVAFLNKDVFFSVCHQKTENYFLLMLRDFNNLYLFLYKSSFKSACVTCFTISIFHLQTKYR